MDKIRKCEKTSKIIIENFANFSINDIGRIAVDEFYTMIKLTNTLKWLYHLGNAGLNKNDSVVDKNCKIHDTKNLLLQEVLFLQLQVTLIPLNYNSNFN